MAIAIAVIIFLIPRQDAPGAPDVRFTEFTPDRTDIKVGEFTTILFNVQNLESRTINGSKVTVVIEPQGYQPYISISDPTIELPQLQGMDARTGQKEVIITATASPANEAVYTIKGILIVEGQQSDIREFELRIRQE